MADINRALDDIAFIAKRFAGLIEVGEQLKQVQVLVNQRDSLVAAVEAASKELDDTKAKVSKAKSDLRKTDSDFVSQQKTMSEILEGHQSGLAAVQGQIKGATAEYKALQASARAEADRIIADANASPAGIQKAPHAEVAEAQSKLASIQAEIAKLKNKF